MKQDTIPQIISNSNAMNGTHTMNGVSTMNGANNGFSGGLFMRPLKPSSRSASRSSSRANSQPSSRSSSLNRRETSKL